ncbi:MAG: preprotein translocase subunit SecA [Clostridia bacterium]
MGLIETLFGNTSKKEIKRIIPLVTSVSELSQKYKAMTDEELKATTPLLKERLEKGETLDDILPDAFAVVREAALRVIGLYHYDVQIMGGIILHQGRIAEMKTGEGKTLVATLAAYLNALSGKGVHIITVNDYLAKRDSEWMGKVYRFLGLSVGLVIHGVENDDRKNAYNCDITYGTNNEFGFDYLRDNMVAYKEQMVQRKHNFAIVDEVDSILIDEARTPLIISGASDKSTDMYAKADLFAKKLTFTKMTEMDTKENYDEIDSDYIIDEKAKNAILLKGGMKKAEEYFNVENISDAVNSELFHHINQAIKAHGIMHRDIDYVVKDGEVIIVDEFTGRLMFGRRYNQGLHQAIEAKENVKVESESKTLATITFQNYFRLYNKLSGMTGTALTEQDEFQHIYKLDVVEIPTNKPLSRIDSPDIIYKTEVAKFNAVIEQIKECNEIGQPVLVGTVSIEKSEILGQMLKKENIKHCVLNAKYHEKEAEIIAQAGKFGAVTIATNMAGRGTDIILGGNSEYMAKAEMRKQGIEEWLIAEATGFAETDNSDINDARAMFSELSSKYKKEIDVESKKVTDAGGLYIIGTERHESRRIDNQLRGRAGRQGDPGKSRFYLSLEDDLMRLFGGERVYNVMNSLGVEEDQPIEAKILSSSIESAQKKIEGINFERRKNVLKYDDVMNQQRNVIYSQRKKVLDGENLKETITKMAEDLCDNVVAQCIAGQEYAENWDFLSLSANVADLFTLSMDFKFTEDELSVLRSDSLKEMIMTEINNRYAAQEELNTPEIMREVERMLLLRAVDSHWMDHIDAMDDLREGIGLRAYAQRDPVVEYRFESYDMFEGMVNAIKEETVRNILSVVVKKNEEVKRTQVARPLSEHYASEDDGKKVSTTVTKKAKVGRNDPCPCGSGKKYKKCCGQDE